jgi:hypothetical protein
MKLAIPLAESQVVAAGALHDRLEGWVAAERALDNLAATMPSNTELHQVLVKAATLNQLYGTNVYRLHDMALNIVEIFSFKADPEDECALVDHIADVPTSAKFHDSFASKYCHFFVDPRRFPLFDRYVPLTVRLHLGKGNYRCKANAHIYRNLYADLVALRANLSFSPTVRELDRYLWLRGQWETFASKREKAKIGSEVKNLFKTAEFDDDVGFLFHQMCSGILGSQS